MDWSSWLGKRIFVTLSTGRCYTGVVRDVTQQGEIVFFVMVDKYNKDVIFSTNQIQEIKEDAKNGYF